MAQNPWPRHLPAMAVPTSRSGPPIAASAVRKSAPTPSRGGARAAEGDYHRVMQELGFDDLHLFERLVALGTLTAAARERGVPVGQVSRSLARIERVCGTLLLRRSSHGLTLTEDGDCLLGYCRRIARTLGDLQQEFNPGAQPVSGRVRVAASLLLTQHWLVPSLPDLLQQYPALSVDLLAEGPSTDVLHDSVDVLVCTDPSPTPHVLQWPLGQLDTGLYASPSYLQEHGEPGQPLGLARHRLLSNCAHPVLNGWAFADGSRLQADGRVRADTTAAIAALALQGLGVAHLPRKVGDAHAAQGLLRPVLPGQVQTAAVQVCAMVQAERQRLPRLRACLTHWSATFAAAPIQRIGASEDKAGAQSA
jgi:DNA-binding transcriptional LysR family regulator